MWTERADLVLVEGAGSASEVNLRRNDIANMGFAEAADVPVVPPLEHGGRTLHEHLTSGAHHEVMTSLRTSLVSHVLAFLADESRTKGGTPLPVPAIFERSGAAA